MPKIVKYTCDSCGKLSEKYADLIHLVSANRAEQIEMYLCEECYDRLNAEDNGKPEAAAEVVVGKKGTYTDPRDGKVYKTVIMPDGKEWLAENLNFEIEGSWYYNNDLSNGDKYGRLYTWDAAVKACAGLGNGWRLPTNEDWDTLITAVGGSSTASTKLKSRTGWVEYGNGTDEYGISALPGGYRYSDGFFYNAGYNGVWWSAKEGDDSYAYNRDMHYNNKNVARYYSDKSNAFSVRCSREPSGHGMLPHVERGKQCQHS